MSNEPGWNSRRSSVWLVASWLAVARGAAAQAAPAEAPPAREVIVAGAPLRHAASSPTLASSVVRAEALASPGASAADVLARLPGMQVARTGAQSDVATASIRGADARQVPVYLAGVRLNDEVSGTADLASVPLWMIDRVEVYRGNAPARADRLGMAGAIFFWPRLPQHAGAGAGVALGSFGERSAHAFFAVGSRRSAALVAVRRSGARNDYPYLDDRGQRFELDERPARRQNADFAQTEAWVVGRHGLGPGVRLSSVLSLVDREQGLTGLSVVPARAARGRTRRLLYGVSALARCGFAPLCQVELDSSGIAARARVDDPLLELGPVLSRFVDNRGERTSQRARVSFEPVPRLGLGLGVSVAVESLRVRRAGSPERGGTRRSAVPVMDVAWQLAPGLSVHALGALECHATRGRSVRFGAEVQASAAACTATPAGRLGLRYELGRGVELLGNVSRALRVPSLAELYGTASLVDGNPSLRAERSASVDAGVRLAAPLPGRGRLSLDAFAFARQARDLVRWRRSSLEALAPFNVAEARLLGVELAVSAELLSHVRLEAAGTLLDPRETTDDPVLDPTPNDLLPNTARSTSSVLGELYHEAPLGPLSRLSVGLRHHHKSSRFEDPAGQTVLPAQSFWDVELSAQAASGQVALRAAVRNLTDAQTSDLIGLPVPGRSLHAAFELSL